MREKEWKGRPAIVLFFALCVALPLFGELADRDHLGWTISLGLILIALVLGAFLLARFLRNNMDEVGEARFDTSDQGGSER